MTDSKTITIFTDGSSRGNPGPGGWGAVIVYNDGKFKVKSLKLKVVEIGERENLTTNNRMELRAAIGALEFVSANLKITTGNLQLYSDSSYLVNGITKWVKGWQQNGWVTKAKTPVENKDLWQRLTEISKDRNVGWHIIEGHAGLSGNERCDEIATAFADNLKPDLYSGSLEKYQIKNILDIKIDAEKKTKKEEDRDRSKAKAYSYVSLVDGVIKIHRSWAECEQRVKGKPAKYKKSLSPEDEQAIIKSFTTGI